MPVEVFDARPGKTIVHRGIAAKGVTGSQI